MRASFLLLAFASCATCALASNSWLGNPYEEALWNPQSDGYFMGEGVSLRSLHQASYSVSLAESTAPGEDLELLATYTGEGNYLIVVLNPLNFVADPVTGKAVFSNGLEVNCANFESSPEFQALRLSYATAMTASGTPTTAEQVQLGGCSVESRRRSLLQSDRIITLNLEWKIIVKTTQAAANAAGQAIVNAVNTGVVDAALEAVGSTGSTRKAQTDPVNPVKPVQRYTITVIAQTTGKRCSGKQSWEKQARRAYRQVAADITGQDVNFVNPSCADQGKIGSKRGRLLHIRLVIYKTDVQNQVLATMNTLVSSINSLQFAKKMQELGVSTYLATNSVPPATAVVSTPKTGE